MAVRLAELCILLPERKEGALNVEKTTTYLEDIWKKPSFESASTEETLYKGLGGYFKCSLTSYTRLLICSLLNDKFVQENKLQIAQQRQS